jgi:N-acetylneuraminate synthase/N,N'-diacetyllegionaminate synthase
MKKIKIANKFVGDNHPVFITAEAGINHNGNVKTAKEMVREAKESGSDAIKFQTFKADDLASEISPFYKIFKKLELDDSEFGEISDFAKSQDIIFYSTPFSEEAVDLLTRLHVPVFKIASGDLTHIPLIRYVATKKKPMILSTGMADLAEIKKSIASIKSKNNKIMIMHSVSAYPTPENEVNLKAIETLKNRFPYPVGFSDNGPDLLVPLCAISLGANLIEKHFTLNQKMRGPDHSFSADPKQFKNLVESARKIEQMFGDGIKRCQPSELANRTNARRSILSKVPIEKGTIITEGMIAVKRPAIGILPQYFDKVIGNIVKRRIRSDEPITWKDIS